MFLNNFFGSNQKFILIFVNLFFAVKNLPFAVKEYFILEKKSLLLDRI